MNINELASAANKAQKLSKPKLYERVLKIVTTQDGDMSFDDMVALYAFFVPAVPAKPKTQIQWIYKAVPKNDVRYYLNQAYCDGEYLVGTDGHRLHAFELEDKLEPGYYNSELVKIECDGRYPDWKRVMPSMGLSTHKTPAAALLMMHELRDIIDRAPVEPIDEGKPAQKIEIFGRWVNRVYLLDALSWFNESESVDVFCDEDKNDTSIQFTQGHKQCVIMPMRF